MKLYFIIIFFLVNIVGGFLGLAYYIGLFNTVHIEYKTAPPFQAILKKHIGTYKKVGRKIMMTKNHVENTLTVKCYPLAVYYSDSKKVIQRFLESAGGCHVDAKYYTNMSIKQPFFKDDFFKNKPKTLYLKIKAHPGIAYNKMNIALQNFSAKHKLNIEYPIIENLNNQNFIEYWVRYKN